MTNKFLIGVSTYLKNGALREFLDSAIKNDYLETCDILICDDADGHAKEVFAEYPQKGLLYTTGSNLGIARNKNRAIRFFLEQKHYTHLILTDDDMLFTAPGLFEECIAAGWPHTMGYLGEMSCSLEGARGGFFDTFPIKGKTDIEPETIFTNGSQGVMLYMTRDVVEKCMYYPIAPGRYGYEHSIYSNIINNAYLKYAMDWFPFLKTFPKFMVGNYNHPNQYEAKPEENQKWWLDMRNKIQSGVDYINKKSGVPDGEEVLKHEL